MSTTEELLGEIWKQASEKYKESQVTQEEDVEHTEEEVEEPKHVQRPKRLAKSTPQSQSTKETETPKKSRIGRSMYVATANNGTLGIIDKKTSVGGHSILLVHVPKKIKDFTLDLKVGECLTVRGLTRSSVQEPLCIMFVGRSQYFPPGKKVSSCVVGVDTAAWDRFMMGAG